MGMGAEGQETAKRTRKKETGSGKKGERAVLQNAADIERIVDGLTLFDDDLMSLVFDGNVPAAELVLRIILKRDDIKVVRVVGQKELENPLVKGRNIRIDILARDSAGRFFNVEVQRDSAGADVRRARFHSSMVDSRMLGAGQEFCELRESYVIFITEEDYFRAGLPVYTIERHIEEMGRKFQDGSHIIYVNGSYRNDDPIGRLMRDFACKDAKDIHYQELAEGVRHFKEEKGGREVMCQAVEEYADEVAKRAVEKYADEVAKRVAKGTAIEAAIRTAIKYGIEKERIIPDINEEFGISGAEAEKLYEAYAQDTDRN